MRFSRRKILLALFIALVTSEPAESAAAAEKNALQATVDQAVRPVMAQYGIPGMTVGVTVDGRHATFEYGVASKATGQPVDTSTLFEIGSITKTFTASLVSYAQVTGRLSLSDRVSADFPPLRGTSFDHIRLVNLGTYTAGGLPLQFPDAVQTDEDAMRYYAHWKPSHEAGTYRRYSNASIMLLGVVAAARLHSSFSSLMQSLIFAPLGMHSTFLSVPGNQWSRYAQGYTDAGIPKRMKLGPLALEAYGIRTTASDMLRFIDANLNMVHVSPALSSAITATHTEYYRAGPMTQDLVWEQYQYPASLSTLLQGNSEQMIFDENKVTKIDPPVIASGDVLLDKTGSTNGFGAYVAFIPRRKLGIVVLATKSYPIDARVSLAYKILSRLQ